MANDLHSAAADAPTPAEQPAAVAPAPSASERRIGDRLVALAIFLPCAAVLLVAALLEPSSRGVGTHEQLGLPPCGFLATTGLPCATCGMTTSFSHAAGGNLLASFLTQPAGAMLALLTAMAAVVSGYALVSGMSLGPISQRLWRPRFVVLLIALLIAGWIYTITRTLLGT